MTLRTARLHLRRWRTADIDPFAALNADPEVMRHFVSVRNRTETAAQIERFEATFDAYGYGAWAMDLPGTGCIGFCGLLVPRFKAHFTPCVEIGWRMARAHWGQGYATEAARAALADAFGRCGLREMLAFAVPANLPSLRVMERIGMTRDNAGDFDHPNVPDGHALQRHLLYRVSAPAAPA